MMRTRRLLGPRRRGSSEYNSDNQEETRHTTLLCERDYASGWLPPHDGIGGPFGLLDRGN